MKISHKKQIFYILPTWRTVMKHESKAEFILHLYLLSWRPGELWLMTILWGLLFRNLVLCVAAYRRMLKPLKMLNSLYLNQKSCTNIACTMKADLIAKQNRYNTYLFVPSSHYCCWQWFWRWSLFAIPMQILTGFHISYTC